MNSTVNTEDIVFHKEFLESKCLLKVSGMYLRRKLKP